jgi:ankyrin repeat protein
LNNGADVNLSNNNGTTPLIFSCMYNKIESVKVLIEHKADTSAKDSEGKTALDYARENSFSEIVDLLE